MFDTYTIPATPTTDYDYPQPDVTLPELMTRVEERFNLPPGTLKKRWEVANTPVRKYGDVYLSDIRKALVVIARDVLHMKNAQVCRDMGLDHGSSISAYKKGTIFLMNNDQKFKRYYSAVFDCL